MIHEQFLHADRPRLSGVQNFPTVGLIDGTFRANSKRPAWATA
jgi:predicted TIM-barrel enzyme